MRNLVIDAQGGGIGKQLVAAIKRDLPEIEITAVGTNSVATGAMLKAGADQAATGENAVIVASRRAEVILGPLGIVIADALLGEITPAMAQAVGQAEARRILIPVGRCENLVAGVGDKHIDLYWCLWSLNYNLKTDKYTDFFLKQYGKEKVDMELLKLVKKVEEQA